MKKCRERLEAYLRENGAGFQVMTHAQSFTMQEVAASLGVAGSQVAKVVIVCADDEKAMLVLPAPNRVNTEKVASLVGASKVRMAKEEEFEGLFPDCATGAMPPFGNLYNVPVYVDEALAAQDDIVFRIGTHREAMRMAYADFARLAQPTVGQFAWLM